MASARAPSAAALAPPLELLQPRRVVRVAQRAVVVGAVARRAEVVDDAVGEVVDHGVHRERLPARPRRLHHRRAPEPHRLLGGVELHQPALARAVRARLQVAELRLVQPHHVAHAAQPVVDEAVGLGAQRRAHPPQP
jgi:hypothetical protein